MNQKSPPRNRTRSRNASIQWLALVVVATLAMLAAFVFFGEDSGGGGHSGIQAPAATWDNTPSR